MARVQQPLWLNDSDVPELPAGWRALTTEEASAQLKPGKLFDNKTVKNSGSVPVLSQGSTGFIGFHDESPGVIATSQNPVVTFANHTCEMRLMKQPFSVIQNIFPKIGKPSEVDTTYFFYAAQGRVNQADYRGHHPLFRQCRIPIPPLSVQNSIASILSAYDDLIENNTRRIAILEEMARRIYEEWFVHFRFPGHEQAKMVESELGLIPEGWRVFSFTDLFDVHYGKTLPTKNLARDGEFPVYGGGGVIGRYTDYVVSGPTCLITSRGNGSGTVWKTTERAFVTNNSFVVLPKSIYKNLSFGFVELFAKNAPIKNVLGGAAVPQLTLDGLASLRVIGFDSSLAESFDEILRPMYDLVVSLHHKNANLRATRDLLLPKLISGEIDVSSLEDSINLNPTFTHGEPDATSIR